MHLLIYFISLKFQKKKIHFNFVSYFISFTSYAYKTLFIIYHSISHFVNIIISEVTKLIFNHHIAPISNIIWSGGRPLQTPSTAIVPP